ncbi:MAG: DUF2845 domain-containing protein [Woeseiaceae bacterium]|nr:DUF2845 domain-containing protein [Woeseiaceae bacterium]
MRFGRQITLAATTLCVGLLAADPAFAFRCKSKIVKDGMHEQQVIAICGEPTSKRQLGYTVRSLSFGWRQVHPGGFTARRFPAYAQLSEEVIVTEYIYNLGPRKLMRRLIFEGGVLVSIETIGYGYLEKNR